MEEAEQQTASNPDLCLQGAWMYIFCHSVISGKFQKSSLLWVYILWRSCSKCLYNCYIDTLQCSANVYNNNVRFRAMCSSFQMWQRNIEEPIIALPPTWLVSIVILNVSSHFFEAKKILPSNIDSTFHFQVGTGARRNINVEVSTLRHSMINDLEHYFKH